MDESLYNETSTGNANDTTQVSEFTIDEFVSVTYTEYKSHLNYSLEPTYSKLGMDFIHKFTRTLFESYYAPDEDAPEGKYFTLYMYHLSCYHLLINYF